MGGTIWIFVHHLVVECENYDIDVKAFSNCEDAYKAFKEWKESELLYCKYWVVKENTENYFEAFEEGDFFGNHSIGYVKRLEVNDGY